MLMILSTGFQHDFDTVKSWFHANKKYYSSSLLNPFFKMILKVSLFPKLKNEGKK